MGASCWLVGMALAACVGGVASADTVIYDSLSITANHEYDRTTGNCIGFPPDSGVRYDLQIVDDFVTTGPMVITRVTTDYVCSVPAPHNLAAVWVQIFATVNGNAPSDEVTAEFIAPASAVNVIDLGQLVWNSRPPGYNNGTRIEVDLTSENIQLPAGTWWVSIQPVLDETAEWYWSLRDYDNLRGFDTYFRNGGPHHAGAYGGGTNVLITPDFDNFVKMGDAGFLVGTLPMKVEGRGVCAGDFNGSGAVSVQDIFDFLAAYFSSDAAADVNHSGGVTVQDIFDYLAAYFAGCA